MADASEIQWTDATFNPWRGCTKVSPGCANCYAETLAGRNPGTLGVWGPQGTRVVAAEPYWRLPLRWDREASQAGRRRRVFCASLADWLEPWGGPMHDAAGRRLLVDGLGAWRAETENVTGRPWPLVTMTECRARLLALIRQTPSLDWLLLTKRPEGWFDRLHEVVRHTHDRADEIASAWLDGDAPPNVWLGVSVEDQQRADERIPHLLATPAAVRFLSVEPMLGPVDLDKIKHPMSAAFPENAASFNCLTLKARWDAPGIAKATRGKAGVVETGKIGWVIVGGESGPGARPCQAEWVRSLVRQCAAAGTACFVKQLGANYADAENGVCGKATRWPLDVLPGGPTRRLADPKGGDLDEFPEDLKVRQFPKAR